MTAAVPRSSVRAESVFYEQPSVARVLSRMLLPWFVVFLIVGECADYFVTEIAVGTATALSAKASGAGGDSPASSTTIAISDKPKKR